MTGELIPISDEQAKAIGEAFKFGTQSLKTAKAFAGYVANILGTVPEDLVGLLGGDWLRYKRVENIVRVAEQTKERLKARKVDEPEPVSLSIALPILEGAADENREELVDLWARLLAAAMDPARASRVRREFVETVRAMDPLDAVILTSLPDVGTNLQSPIAFLSNRFSATADEVEVSLHHLVRLGCVRDSHTRAGEPVISFKGPTLTVAGRELLRLLAD